jgi:hypothetical protein
MSTVAQGAFAEVVASTRPSGPMIQPIPPHPPAASTRLDDRQKAPDRTAATTPAASHFPVVAPSVARGAQTICTCASA